LVQIPLKSAKKYGMSYSEKYSGTFFMAHGVYRRGLRRPMHGTGWPKLLWERSLDRRQANDDGAYR